MSRNSICLALSFINFLVLGQALAEEKVSSFFVAVQISDNVIKPFAEYSEGKWKPIVFKSSTVDLGYEILPNTPWNFRPKKAMLNSITINAVAGSKVTHWYSLGSKKPLLVSQFTQYGNNIESERIGWGMTVSGKEALGVSEDWYRYPKKLLFSKIVHGSPFRLVDSRVVKRELYEGFQERMLTSEEIEVKTNLDRCYDKMRSEELNNYAFDYCEYWERYSVVIKAVSPDVVVKKASLKGVDIYYVQATKLTPLKPKELCPRETQLQAWVIGANESVSLMGENITLTDCDGKEAGTIVEPFSTIDIDGKHFVFSENFGYEGSGYVIREIKGGHLDIVFNPNMYGEEW